MTFIGPETISLHRKGQGYHAASRKKCCMIAVSLKTLKCSSMLSKRALLICSERWIMDALLRRFWLWKRSASLNCKTRYGVPPCLELSDIFSYQKLISFWTIRFPPRLRPRLAETVNLLMNVRCRAISDVIWLSDTLIYFWFSDTLISNLADATRTGDICFNYSTRPHNSCPFISFLYFWRAYLYSDSGWKKQIASHRARRTTFVTTDRCQGWGNHLPC